MRYYVITDDGNRYGPAEVETLAGWIGEGRLLPTTLLEEEGSGARIAASAVSGLNFPTPPMEVSGVAGPQGPAANPYSAPPAGGAAYQRPQAMQYGDDGQKDVTTSWVLGVIGFFCCGFILAPIGIVYANKAKEKGNPNAQAPFIFNIVITALAVIGWLYILINIATFRQRFGGQPAGVYQPMPAPGNSLKL